MTPPSLHGEESCLEIGNTNLRFANNEEHLSVPRYEYLQEEDQESLFTPAIKKMSKKRKNDQGKKEKGNKKEKEMEKNKKKKKNSQELKTKEKKPYFRLPPTQIIMTHSQTA
jgi:hypothetical protein